MSFSRHSSRVWSVLTLRGTRSLLSALRYRLLVGLIALSYAFAAMLFAGMLYIPPPVHTYGWFLYVYPSGPGPSWTYPVIIAGSPTFLVYVPIVSGILMTLSAAGVGLGMSLAVLLAARLIRRRKATLLRPTAVGSVAGLTPVMIALVTLGACCSTAAAATAGISLAAQSSGTTPAAALANAWYLGVFQVAVIYVALIAQEQLLRVYGLLYGDSAEGRATSGAEAGAQAPLTWRGVGGAALRIVLLVAGLTWSLAALTAWFSTPPGRASASAWFGWIFQHEVPGVLAVLVALFPAGTLGFWRKYGRERWTGTIRALLVVSGLSLLTWMPTLLSRAGSVALGNELLGFWRFPASWGAVAPPDIGLVGLSLRWAFQFGLLGGLALAMGISPEFAVKPHLASSPSSARPRNRFPASDTASVPSESG